MILVEGGSFTMGCTDGECGEESGDFPAHSVTMSSYKIAKYPITQQQWEAIMGNNPSQFKGHDLPVHNITWSNVQEYIQKLNTITGKNYRLPTEAQWEYAARGGKISKEYKYSGSNNIDEVAWYNANSGREVHPVGTKAPNELGIYDMSGNVLEWCSNWYEAYTEDTQIDPVGPNSGEYRIVRGGHASLDAYSSRVSSRLIVTQNYFNGVGVRLVLP
jgi:formylglycine-generating enzyme required for sulfatase activity